MNVRIRRLRTSSRIEITSDPRHLAIDGAGAAVFVIEGRMLARTVDISEGPGIERDANRIVDGYPDVSRSLVGEMIADLLADTNETALPPLGRRLLDYAQPLFDDSPSRYTSYRSWQRRARHVSVRVSGSEASLCRWHADLGRGSWEPGGRLARPEFEQERRLALPTSADLLGEAVLALLAQPAIGE